GSGGCRPAARARGRIRGRAVVEIEAAVEIAVDADAQSRPDRNARIGALLLRRRGLTAELCVGQERVAGSVGLEPPVRLSHPAALHAPEIPLHHHLALVQRRAGDHQVDALADGGRARARERDLLADDGREVRGEGDHELLDLERLGCGQIEDGRAVEVEQPVDAAVMQETEATDLRAHRPELVRTLRVRARLDLRVRRHAERPDLLVHVPELWDLEALYLALEAHPALRAEETIRGVERVTAGAVADGIAQAARICEDAPSVRLVGVEAVVEVPDGVR